MPSQKINKIQREIAREEKNKITRQNREITRPNKEWQYKVLPCH